MAEAGPQAAKAAGFIVLETNFRVMAYTGKLFEYSEHNELTLHAFLLDICIQESRKMM